jgi:monoamine oxidase
VRVGLACAIASHLARRYGHATVPASWTASGLTRRTFLRGAVSGAALAGVGALPETARAASAPRVEIVGAGLAGLTCAHRLTQRGIRCTVYEAHDSRVGGRCWTAREFAEGQTAEHGGEFIDTAHHHIRALAAQLGLHLDDTIVLGHRRRRRRNPYVFQGQTITAADAFAGSGLLTRRADADRRRIGHFGWQNATRAARALDEMTAEEWLRDVAPGPAHVMLRAFTRQFMAEEFGLDCDHLSAITMVQEWSSSGPDSDERFHVHGGNDQIPHRLAARLPAGTLRLGHPLTALRRTATGYSLTFDGQSRDVSAELVILCLPFTALRRVDLSGAGLTARKRRCIDELGMGTDTKVLIQFRRPLTHYDHFGGELTDLDVDTWSSSLGENDRAGLLTIYSGGRYGAGYRAATPHGPAPAAVVSGELARLEHTLPGLAAGFNGHAWLDHWTSDPWTHGSYAAYMPGQFTRFFGLAGRPEGGVHFGGEHTCTEPEALGFMEGAVRSGERCAREVLSRLS